MNMMGQNVENRNRPMNLHYGCGFVVGKSWLNCDGSPTLRLQRLPLIGFALRRFLRPCWPDEVVFGDIVRGLPLQPHSCDAIFCSHVLEHLALDDFRIAIRNTHSYLKPGGVFRLIVPDFEAQIKAYQSNPEPPALSNFLGYTFLGRKSRPKGIGGWLREYFGNSHHLWMWDYKGIAMELEQAGFCSIRRFEYGETALPAFREVESKDRFLDALAVECTRK
jgi:SAM-dependent methyltransferase